MCSIFLLVQEFDFSLQPVVRFCGEKVAKIL